MAAGIRVLIADDDEVICDLVSFKLSQAGYAVQVVRDGATALQAITTERPGLAILDVMMPGLSGFDVLRKLRQDPATADQAVILLTAKSRDTDIDTGFVTGAQDYIVKPFSPRELLHRVNGVLARSRR
ncbi:MAG TPA: response regulator [Dermatophilaceae bacterium]|nr:response regulator [Dermatophilaceae bacterium]